MERLRFSDAQVKLQDAALLLAMNQNPWADEVRCSPYDFLVVGYRADRVTLSVMLPNAWASSYEFDAPTDRYHIDHKVMLVMDDDCPIGEVRL